MGKEIVYCDVCGERVLEEEFARGRAVTVQNRNYCARCKRDVFGDEAPPSDARAESSHRLRAVEPPAPHRSPSSTTLRPLTGKSPHRPAAPGKPNTALIAGAVVGGLAVILLIALALSGGGSPPGPAAPSTSRPREADREDAARAAMARLDPLVKPAIADPDRVLALAREIQDAVAGTSHEARLRGIVDDAHRVKEDLAKTADLERALGRIRDKIAADRDFAQYDDVRDLLAKAESQARPLGSSWSQKVSELSAEYDSKFDTAALARSRDIGERARGLAGQKLWADAIRAIDEGFAGAWRRTNYWRSLEKQKQDYERELAASEKPPEPPPHETPPPQPSGRDRFGFPVSDPPPLNSWTAFFNGKSRAGWMTYNVPGEKAENWTVENGELVGTSSIDTDDQMIHDILASTAIAISDFELEFKLKIETGGFFVGGRFEPGAGTTGPKLVGTGLNGARGWTTVTLVLSGSSGKLKVEGGTPLDLDTSSGAEAGRVVFGLAPGAKVRLKDVKILRKK